MGDNSKFKAGEGTTKDIKMGNDSKVNVKNFGTRGHDNLVQRIVMGDNSKFKARKGITEDITMGNNSEVNLTFTSNNKPAIVRGMKLGNDSRINVVGSRIGPIEEDEEEAIELESLDQIDQEEEDEEEDDDDDIKREPILVSDIKVRGGLSLSVSGNCIVSGVETTGENILKNFDLNDGAQFKVCKETRIKDFSGYRGIIKIKLTEDNLNECMLNIERVNGGKHTIYLDDTELPEQYYHMNYKLIAVNPDNADGRRNKFTLSSRPGEKSGYQLKENADGWWLVHD
jgi:hypothetical protein